MFFGIYAHDAQVSFKKLLIFTAISSSIVHHIQREKRSRSNNIQDVEEACSRIFVQHDVIFYTGKAHLKPWPLSSLSKSQVRLRNEFERLDCQHEYTISQWIGPQHAPQNCDLLIFSYCSSSLTSPTLYACMDDIVHAVPVYHHTLSRTFVRQLNDTRWHHFFKQMYSIAPYLHGAILEATVQLSHPPRQLGNREIISYASHICDNVPIAQYRGIKVLGFEAWHCWHGVGHMAFQGYFTYHIFDTERQAQRLCDIPHVLDVHVATLRQHCRMGYFMETMMSNIAESMRNSSDMLTACGTFHTTSWISSCVTEYTWLSTQFAGSESDKIDVQSVCKVNHFDAAVCAYLEGSQMYLQLLRKYVSFENERLDLDAGECEAIYTCKVLMQTCSKYIVTRKYLLSCISGALEAVTQSSLSLPYKQIARAHLPRHVVRSENRSKYICAFIPWGCDAQRICVLSSYIWGYSAQVLNSNDVRLLLPVTDENKHICTPGLLEESLFD